jgi:hypothetical protein
MDRALIVELAGRPGITRDDVNYRRVGHDRVRITLLPTGENRIVDNLFALDMLHGHIEWRVRPDDGKQAVGTAGVI